MSPATVNFYFMCIQIHTQRQKVNIGYWILGAISQQDLGFKESKPQKPNCFPIPSRSFKCAIPHQHSPIWMLEIELKSSFLQGKHFTNWRISSDLFSVTWKDLVLQYKTSQQKGVCTETLRERVQTFCKRN